MPVVASLSNNNPFLSSSPIHTSETNTIYNNKQISSVPYSASADNINSNARSNFVIKMKSNTGNNKDSTTNNNNNNNESISKFEITQTAYRQLQITHDDNDDDNLIKTYPSRRKHTDLINQNNENSCQISAKMNRVVGETTANNSQSNQINEIDIGAKLFSNSLCLPQQQQQQTQQLDTEIASKKFAADVNEKMSVCVERKGNTNPFINNDNDERKIAEDEDDEDKKDISHYNNNNINVTNDKLLDLSHNSNIQSENERQNKYKNAGGNNTGNNEYDDETLDKKSILHMPDFNDFGKSIDNNMSDDDIADDYDDDAYCKSEVIDYVSNEGTEDGGDGGNMRQFSASPTNAKLYHPSYNHAYLHHNQKQVRRVIKDNHYARRGKYDSYNSIARQVVKNKTVSTAVVCQDKKSSMATVLYTSDTTPNDKYQLKSAIPTCSFNRQDYNQLDDRDETQARDLDTNTTNIAKNMKRINIKRGLVKSLDLFNFSFVSHHKQHRSKTDTCEDKCAINNTKTSSTKSSTNIIIASGTHNTWGNKYKSSSQKQKDIGIYYPASTSTLISTKRIGRNKGIGRKNIDNKDSTVGNGKYFDKIQARVRNQLDKLEQKCKRIHKSSNTLNSENMKHSHTTIGGGQTYDIDEFLSTAVSSSGTRAKTSSIYLQKHDNGSSTTHTYTDNNDKFCDRPNHNKFLYKSYKSEIDLTKNLTYLDAFLDEKFDMGCTNNQNKMLRQQQDIVQTQKMEHGTKNCNYEHRRTKSYTKNNAIVSINQSKDRHHILEVNCEEDSSKTSKVATMPTMVQPATYTTTSSSLSSSDYASGYSYTGSNETREKLILTFDDNPVEYALPLVKRNSVSNSTKEKKSHLERHKYHDEFYDVDKKDTHYMLQQYNNSGNNHDYITNKDIYDDDDEDHTAFSYTNLPIPSSAKDIRFDNFQCSDYRNDINFSNSISTLDTSHNYAHSSVITSNNLSLDESNLMHQYERVVGKRRKSNAKISRSNSNSIKELTYHENYLEHYNKNKSSKNNLNLSQNSIISGQIQQPYSTITMTHNLFYDLNAPTTMGAPIGNVNEDNTNEQNGKKRKSNNTRNNKVTTTSLGHHYCHRNSSSSNEYNTSNAILQNSVHRMNNDTVSSSTSSYQSTSSGSTGGVGKSNAQRVIVSKSNKQVGGELVVEYEC